jgi:NitT/TauT family transport system ATP-binding protein
LTTLISVRDLVVRFGDHAVLDGVSFDVGEGEFACVLGSSGAGKTTLLRVLGGLLRPTSGEVRIGGESPDRAWARAAYVFQAPRLVPWRTALGNIELAQELRFGKKDGERARHYLAMVGLADHARHFPAVLSGGERQRVALARALAVEPEVIYMDEPFSALDEVTRARLRNELREIWQRERRTIVFVTHDTGEAQLLATRVVTLSSTGRR